MILETEELETIHKNIKIESLDFFRFIRTATAQKTNRAK